MKNKKTLLLATLGGAVVGALIARYGTHIPIHYPAFAVDRPLFANRLFIAAGIPWVAFSLYWEVAAKNASAAKHSESRASRALHVVLANIAILLAIAPIRGLGRFLPVSNLVIVVGLAIEAAGLFLTIWSRRVLGRNWSGEISIKVEHELVRSGPYKLLRHPIYTGLLTMYVGTALAAGEWLSIIGLAMAFFAYWRKIRLEELNLRTAFGADYDAYCNETWALLPGLF